MKRVKLLALVAILLMILTACGRAKQAKLPEKSTVELIRVENATAQLLITHSEEVGRLYDQLAKAKKADVSYGGDVTAREDALTLTLQAGETETVLYLYAEEGKIYLEQPRVGTWSPETALYDQLQTDLRE